METNAFFINSAIIAFIYLFIKFIEMRFIIKQNKPFKELFRETTFVFLSGIISFYLIDQFGGAVKKGNYESTKAFLGSPEF
jgi:hypothetical protein